MISVTYGLYWVQQWRHARAKRHKSSAFRVRPALEVIRGGLPWCIGFTALDIGPRNMEEVRLLETVFAHVDAVDLFPTAPRIHRGRMERLPFPDKRYDLVFLSHVFEHAYDPRRAVSEIRRVLKRPGYVWIAVPQGFEANPHDRRYEPGELVALFGDDQLTLWWKADPHELQWLFQVAQ